MVGNAPEATGTWAATGKDPGLWVIKPKSPRWHHTKGSQQEGEPSPPALVQLRWQVTFKDSPKKDARAKEPHLPTWRDDRGVGDQSNWSKTEEEDLATACPLLNPHVQEFLMGGEVFLAAVGEDDLPKPSPWRAWHG